MGGGNLGERANKKQRTRQKRGNHKKKHRTTEQLMMTGISALEFTFRSWFFCIFMLKYRGSIMNESEHIWRKNTHLRWNYLPANRTSKQGIFQPRWEFFFWGKDRKNMKRPSILTSWPGSCFLPFHQCGWGFNYPVGHPGGMRATHAMRHQWGLRYQVLMVL